MSLGANAGVYVKSLCPVVKLEELGAEPGRYRWGWGDGLLPEGWVALYDEKRREERFRVNVGEMAKHGQHLGAAEFQRALDETLMRYLYASEVLPRPGNGPPRHRGNAMKACEQLYAVMVKAAEMALPITALEVEPAFYAALEDECRAMLPEPPPPRQGRQALTFFGPRGAVRITERPA